MNRSDRLLQENLLLSWHTDGEGYRSHDGKWRIQENEDGLPGWTVERVSTCFRKTRKTMLLALLSVGDIFAPMAVVSECDDAEARYWADLDEGKET